MSFATSVISALWGFSDRRWRKKGFLGGGRPRGADLRGVSGARPSRVSSHLMIADPTGFSPSGEDGDALPPNPASRHLAWRRRLRYIEKSGTNRTLGPLLARIPLQASPSGTGLPANRAPAGKVSRLTGEVQKA